MFARRGDGARWANIKTAGAGGLFGAGMRAQGFLKPHVKRFFEGAHKLRRVKCQPFDGNGIFVYGHTQVTNEAMIVVDDYCIVAGTDTNYPWTNQFDLDPEQMEDWQETRDARFMVVCFQEPIFATDLLGRYMMHDLMTMDDGDNSMTMDDSDNVQVFAQEEDNSGAASATSSIVTFSIALALVSMNLSTLW